jgi:hypothetical protein
LSFSLFSRFKDTNPVALAELVRTVLVGITAVGWFTIPDALIASIVSAVTALTSIILSVGVHNAVTGDSVNYPKATPAVLSNPSILTWLDGSKTPVAEPTPPTATE